MNQLIDLGTNFSGFDWAIIVVYLVVTVCIGLYANRYVENMTDYIVAGRSLNSFLGIATMLGSEIGLVTVMYSAQKGFTGGFAAFHIGLLAGLVALIVGVTGFLVVPLRRLKVMTIPEFYELRFGTGVRVVGGLILALTGILNMGVFLKAGAIFLTGLTGITDPNAVNIIMTVMIVLVLAYTILGGMLSVVITDYLQFVVLSFGLLLTCVLAVSHIGWSNIVETVKTVHGEAGFNPFDGEGFGPSYVLQMALTAGLVSCAVWPTSVMRACAVKDTGVVRKLYMWSSIGFMTRFIIPQFLGICALAYLWSIPAASNLLFTSQGAVVDNANLTLQAMPVFLSKILPVGIIGLIGAGMLAAFMSTHDSYLLCWASVLVEDVANPVMGKKLSNRARIGLARLFIFLIGVFLLVWSLWYPLGQDMWDYLAVTAAIYFTGAIALLVGGLYWKRASRMGAYLALATGSLAILGLGPIRELLHLTQDDLGIEYNESHIVLAITALALVMMVAGSLLFPDRVKPAAAGSTEEEPTDG
ncbi:MAG: sodium:solute symporter family protein [Planctomycetota bacterium]|jgi:SSS family solute:Na+ symporter